MFVLRSILALLVLAFASTVLAENVVTLTETNFQSTLDGNEFVLVEFYAPWCGHCKSLAPEYESAATLLKAEASKIVLGKVDATVEQGISEGVQGFPTLKFYVNGKAFEYTGGRTSDSIVSWLKKKTGAAVGKLATQAELDEVKLANEVVAVVYGIDDLAAFESAARGLEVPFYVAEGELKTAEVSLTVYKQFDELKAELTGELASKASAADIAAFVDQHSLPLVVPFSQQTAQKIFGGQVKQHVIVFLDKTTGGKDTPASLTEAARAFRGDYLFVTVDKSDARVIDFFGIKTFPDTRIVQLTESGMRKFKLLDQAAPLGEDNLKKSIEEHKQGKLAADFKSEEVPVDAMDGDVKVLVGKNFAQVVKQQPGKHVFVEFYAPWCGHCKQLAPKYEEVGKWASKEHADKLVVAKMDAAQNEVADVEISSFPTLKLFVADSDEIIDYSGEREAAAMIAFLEQHLADAAATAAAK